MWRGLSAPTGVPRTYATPESIEEVRREFGLDESRAKELMLEPPDGETHLDLAIAYREMELTTDAILEAGER